MVTENRMLRLVPEVNRRHSLFLIIGVFIGLMLFSGALPYKGYGEMTPEQIVAKAEDVYAGQDQQSKLTFTIRETDGAERKVVLRRYWKDYKDDPSVDSKVLVFHEYPPDAKGTAFMVWTYKTSAHKPEDMWIYLPILRKVQKLPEHPDEIFSGANLKPADMVRRDANLDKHKLLREETIENQQYYVIESTPKEVNSNYNYGKVVRWIKKNDFQKERVHYYSEDGTLLKTQDINWKHVKNASIWEKVVIKNVKTGVQTILSISDVEIDKGLNDKAFSERVMSTGKVR
ncbi:MAG: outer membrane lipoprotein-sorting protein [Nitrospira sp.]|nr:outer membrane lipoprotein-sorting protein [Nitrospira sp.]